VGASKAATIAVGSAVTSIENFATASLMINSSIRNPERKKRNAGHAALNSRSSHFPVADSADAIVIALESSEQLALEYSCKYRREHKRPEATRLISFRHSSRARLANPATAG
jgi:hypothetical protein